MPIDDVVMLLWATARVTPRVTADLAVLRHARALAYRALQAEMAGDERELPLATALVLVDIVAGAVGDDHSWTRKQFDALVGDLEG